jgi:hypothetical protein
MKFMFDRIISGYSGCEVLGERTAGERRPRSDTRFPEAAVRLDSLVSWGKFMTNDIEKFLEAAKIAERLAASAGGLSGLSEAARSIASFQNAISQHGRGLASIFEDIERSSAAMRLATTDLADLGKALEFRIPQLPVIDTSLFEALEANAAKWRTMMESLDQATRFKIPESSVLKLAQSGLIWNSGVAEAMARFNDAGFKNVHADLCRRLLEPANVFSKFSEDTFSLIREATEPKVLKALNASLALADAQHLANLDTLSAFMESPVDGDAISASRMLVAPFTQRSELLELPEEIDDDVESLVSQSEGAQAVENARGLLDLVTCCNKSSRVKGGPEVFKPTTKLLEVFSDLPWLLPDSEKALGEFIDCLFFLLYEGAGKDNLRFMQKHGGPLADTDCRVIWCVKFLRNKWLRHDADHGKQSDIERSWGDLGAQFRWLGLGGYPKSARDYRQLHRQLLAEVSAFLERLLNAL